MGADLSSTWGTSWGTSWGASWDRAARQVEAVTSGGSPGYYGPGRWSYPTPPERIPLEKRARRAVDRLARRPLSKRARLVERVYRVVAEAGPDQSVAEALAPFARRNLAGTLLPPADGVQFDRLIADAAALRILYLAYFEALEDEAIEILLLAS